MALEFPSVRHVIVDECFQPLLQKFYEQEFKQDDLDLLNQQLMDASSAKRHEALVGIYRLYCANRGLLPKMVVSGLLIKLVYFLKEQQFPQLCFEALRIVYSVVDNAKIAEHFINTGAVHSLLSLVRRDRHAAVLGLSLWSLAKIANRASGDSIAPRVTINEFIEISENPQRSREANAIAAHLIIKLWSNNILLRPEDVDRFYNFLLTEVIEVNIADEGLLKESFRLLRNRWKEMLKSISAKGWKLLRQVLSNLENHGNQILQHYLHFLLEMMAKVQAIAFVEILVSFDVLTIFQGLLSSTSESARLQYCILAAAILSSRIYGHLKYFLGKQSILIKFYYMIESDTPRVKKEVCRLFASLTVYPSEEVLLLYEQAKIAALYFRLLKEQPELVEACLDCLIVILSFAKKLSLTTFNWFLNYLKSEKIEETLEKIKNQNNKKTITELISELEELFIDRSIEPKSEQ